MLNFIDGPPITDFEFVQAGQFAFKRHVGKVVGIPDKPLKLDQNPLSYILIRVGKSSGPGKLDRAISDKAALK